ncbi:UDP-N-acetylmuramoyl-L-alanyl-D-glutamate--2,6-diaminopimelate ligase [Candidatus Parcubacteria bacterium]|nr:UDP-N-acetylmuramoyl-L-alanyl-D-glutamate--2,6-diaminopimelate ligase [Candidatus Parcubacteria bacterium]
MLEKTLRFLERYIIPRSLYRFFQPAYHYLLALAAALLYRFPSRNLKVIGVTGTKGKSSTVELIGAVLAEAGYKTALLSTIHFKVDDEEERNLFKVTMPGRFFAQRFLRKAVAKKCDYAVIEMTSEGSRFFRHKFIALDAFVFTNITPEHIESHGSFEKYLEAKLAIARSLGSSSKRPRIVVANKDDQYAGRFLAVQAEDKRTFSLEDAKPYELRENGIEFTLRGKKIFSHLRGAFNLSNILAAATVAEAFGVTQEAIARALSKMNGIRGRLERVTAGQDFEVIVDYAHTTDSLEKVYQVFQNQKKICVLGGTGGGRDKWKRPEMGRIASAYCDHVILTNEDPYDEDPMAIVNEIKAGIENCEVIIDRREAIRRAIALAQTGDAVIVTGKGTDPYIMGPRGAKIPWDDAQVAREELEKLGKGS